MSSKLLTKRSVAETGLRRQPDYGEEGSYTVEMNEANKSAAMEPDQVDSFMEDFQSMVKSNLPKFKAMLQKPLGYKDLTRWLAQEMGSSEALAELLVPLINQVVDKTLNVGALRNPLRTLLRSPAWTQALRKEAGAKTAIEIPDEEFLDEHERLIDTLRNGLRGDLEDEADEQEAELADFKAKQASGIEVRETNPGGFEAQLQPQHAQWALQDAKSEGASLLVAYQGDSPVGALSYMEGKPGSVDIWHLGSSSPGAGRALVGYLQERYSVINAAVEPPSQGFYEKMKFQPDQMSPDWGESVDDNEPWMWRKRGKLAYTAPPFEEVSWGGYGEKMYEKAKARLEALQFPLTVYRALKVKDEASIKFQSDTYGGVGQFWSNNLSNAKFYTPAGKKAPGEKFVLRALVQEGDVDWDNTLMNNMHPHTGPREQEIVLKRGVKITVDGILVPGDTEFQPRKIHTQASRKFASYWCKAAAGCIPLCITTGRILMGLRGTDCDNPETWACPGGAIDGDEHPEEACRRELREETGFPDADTVELVQVYEDETPDFTYTTFLAFLEEEFTPNPPEEFADETQEFRWVEWGDWPEPLHPGFKDSIPEIEPAVEQVIDAFNEMPDEDEDVENK